MSLVRLILSFAIFPGRWIARRTKHGHQGVVQLLGRIHLDRHTGEEVDAVVVFLVGLAGPLVGLAIADGAVLLPLLGRKCGLCQRGQG